MAISIIPLVGNWYQGPDLQKFEVVAVDDDEAVVEIQYISGELDEVELEIWAQMGMEKISPPEDWSAAYDEMEREDLGFTDLNVRPGSQRFSFEDFDRDD